MFDVRMICYPWDLEDEGVDEVLNRLQGELGVVGVSVFAAGAPACQVRRRPETDPRVFETRGGLFFQPNDSHYVNTRCKPLAAEWLKARNPLAKISEVCRRRDIRFRVLIDTRRMGRFAARFPTLAVKSVFDDVSPERMCFGNSEVRELLRGVIGDLKAQFDPSAVELRYLDRPGDGDVGERSGTARLLGEAGRSLLGVCFCESCRRGALDGRVDVEAAHGEARALLGRALAESRPIAGTLARDNPPAAESDSGGTDTEQTGSE